MIQARGLHKSYGKIAALRGVDFVVNAGEIVGYIGPNGSGKTTTIKMICGLSSPTQGDIRVFSTSVSKWRVTVNRRIGVVLESHGLYPHLTAYENLEFFVRLHGFPARKRREIVVTALNEAALSERMSSLVKTFSKGMMRRLALARALLTQPNILLLDEPFDGVDTESRLNLKGSLMKWISSPHRCIMMTSHNLSDVESLCTRVVFLKKGRVIADQTMDSLLAMDEGALRVSVRLNRLSQSVVANLLRREVASEARIDGNKLFVTLKDGRSISELASILIEDGIDFGEIRTSQGSLEQLYMKLVGDE